MSEQDRLKTDETVRLYVIGSGIKIGHDSTGFFVEVNTIGKSLDEHGNIERQRRGSAGYALGVRHDA